MDAKHPTMVAAGPILLKTFSLSTDLFFFLRVIFLNMILRAISANSRQSAWRVCGQTAKHTSQTLMFYIVFSLAWWWFTPPQSKGKGHRNEVVLESITGGN